MSAVAVGPDSCQVVCPTCQATIMTRVERKSTSKTHVIALILCICGCCPCMCIPYCMNSCRNTDHYCPNCSTFLGTYQR